MSDATRDGERADESPELRVLILEDVATDAELMERELRTGGVGFTATRVRSRSEFEEALRGWQPDVILADYSLPGFDGLEALALAREATPDVPFLFVSGALGEERAIETLRQGATDYVVKDRLSRLAPAVRRAIDEARERRARREAEEELRRSEQTQRMLLELTNAGVTHLDRDALWRATAEALVEVVPLDRTSIALWDRERDTLRVAGMVDRRDGTHESLGQGTEFPREESDLAEVVTSRRPEIRGDLVGTARSETERRLEAQGIRSYVSLPLVGKRGVLGALNVGSREPRAYSQRDVE